MKYLILLMIAFLTGCGESKPASTFTCIHPIILGGQPFQLPQTARFLNNGQIVFTAPTGVKITLIGAFCAKAD